VCGGRDEGVREAVMGVMRRAEGEGEMGEMLFGDSA
jgi:hypothetical protein